MSDVSKGGEPKNGRKFSANIGEKNTKNKILSDEYNYFILKKNILAEAWY